MKCGIIADTTSIALTAAGIAFREADAQRCQDQRIAALCSHGGHKVDDGNSSHQSARTEPALRETLMRYTLCHGDHHHGQETLAKSIFPSR